MKRYGKKLAALLLAVSMLLGLAACGKKEDGQDGKKDSNANKLTGTIYVPEFLEIDLELEGINSGCSDGKNVYLVGTIREPAPPVEGENAEGDDAAAVPTPRAGIAIDAPAAPSEVVNYNYRTGIFRVPLDGGEVAELENYEPTATPEDGEGNVYINSIRTGADGTLWVTEEVNVYRFDLPADFDPENDDKWNYFSGSEQGQIQRQLDATGNEISRVDATGLKEKLGLGEQDYLGYTILDGQGNTYASTDGKITVLDKDMNVLFELTGDNLWGNLSLLGDGTVGMSVWSEEGGQVLRTIDCATKGWGTEYPLPNNAYQVYTGSDKYLFYYDNNDTLYGYNAETSTGEKILSWVSSDINKNNLVFFTFLADGRVVTLTNDWRGESGPKMELAILTETDASVMADKTILTYATMYLDYEVRNKIIDFNKTNGKCRIEIKDYSEYNTNDDYTLGLTKLNTEIGAGNVPDILSTSQIPVRQYGAKGVLEDLWTYIDNDPDLGRDKLMERVLNAAEQDGKLYQIFSSFSIQSVAGATRAVGDRMSWTVADLQEALSNMPEGCTIFGVGDTKEGILNTVLTQNLDSFVDWSTGKCSFDTPEFIALLEFCNSFPLEFDWNNYDWESQPDPSVLLQEGKQLLERDYIYDLQSIQRNKIMFGGDFSYVGYPREDGGVGSTFSIGSGMAMSSKCADKDAAWSFMREMLLPRDTEGNGWYYGDFPVNKADFDAKIAKSMEKQYRRDENGEIMKDENGNPIEESQGGWGWGDQMYDFYAATQEDYDQFMALYNAVDSIISYDEKINNIVKEEAGSYFAGDKSVEETAKLIQSRVNLYVNEQR